jgi:hypothetical protein
MCPRWLRCPLLVEMRAPNCQADRHTGSSLREASWAPATRSLPHQEDGCQHAVPRGTMTPAVDRAPRDRGRSRPPVYRRPLLAGRTVVYFKHFKPSPKNPLVGDMWLADADGTDARRLAARGSPFSARWSPDGTKISYIDLEQGSPRRRCRDRRYLERSQGRGRPAGVGGRSHVEHRRGANGWCWEEPAALESTAGISCSPSWKGGKGRGLTRRGPR